MTRWTSVRPLVVLVGCAFSACSGVASSPGVPVSSAALSGIGSYEVATYTDFPEAPEFGAGTIYYPVGVDGPVGGVAIAPGFTEEQHHIEWWGPRLASHGFAVLILDTNDRSERPEARADALIAAVRTLRDENARPASPLFGRVDPGRMAVMGHSMGGGGALIAANRMGEDVRAVIPFTPWQPEGDFSAITAPTLVIAGQADRIAPVDAHAWPHFQSIPDSTPRVYLEVVDGDHFIADTTRGEDLAMIGRYGIAWLKLYLDGDERYRTFVYGDEQAADANRFSRYVIGAGAAAGAAR